MKPRTKMSYRYARDVTQSGLARVLNHVSTKCSSCQVAQIVKREMETAVKLHVKLKAKVKVGPSWGNLQDLDI